MELLQERIRKEGKVLPGNIIKVDGFLNHRVDPQLLGKIADEFAKFFDISKITVVLTAEASGIPLATVCAQKYGVPTEGEKFAEFWAVMNALYSDYYTVAKKYNVLIPDFFADMAMAFINDKDAVRNKTAVYYECIVEK